MPEPRYTINTRVPVRISLEPSSRDQTAMRRRYRHGTVPQGVVRGGGRFTAGALPVEIRNGLPEFKPYVYQGLGYDQYGDDDDADS